MVSYIVWVKIKYVISKSVSDMVALEIQFYLVKLPLLVSVGVGIRK
jgi:hypothetical protein